MRRPFSVFCGQLCGTHRSTPECRRVGSRCRCRSQYRQNWLSILQTSGIVSLLPPWHNNLSKRLVKTAKLYLVDTGLAAYLAEWSNPQTLEVLAMSGAILETWVVAELLKSYLHNGLTPPF